MDEDVVSRLYRELDRGAALRSAADADPKLQARRHALREWQAARLGHTHADLLASKRMRPAAEFFLSDIYGQTDLAQLGADVRRVVPAMSKLLPADGLETVADAIELDALSEDLDAGMAGALGDAALALDPGKYGEAYRKLGRRPDRERQIALIEDLGQALARLTRLPFVSTTLAVMRKPARLAGFGDLQEFLERGYAAFRQVGDPKEFLELIVGRERRILEALFAGDDTLLAH